MFFFGFKIHFVKLIVLEEKQIRGKHARVWIVGKLEAVLNEIEDLQIRIISQSMVR